MESVSSINWTIKREEGEREALRGKGSVYPPRNLQVQLQRENLAENGLPLVVLKIRKGRRFHTVGGGFLEGTFRSAGSGQRLNEQGPKKGVGDYYRNKSCED